MMKENLLEILCQIHDAAPATADLDTPLVDKRQAVNWIFSMHKEGRLYHFDDSPESIINLESREELFTPDEYARVEARVDELFGILDDPFVVSLICTALDNGGEQLHLQDALNVISIFVEDENEEGN